MANNQPFAEKIFINLNCPPAFQLRQKVLGENNANLTYIVQETKANVTLRGRGSGFAEHNGVESSDPLHLFLQHNNFTKLSEAKTLASNLIETIQMELQVFLQENSQTVQIQQQHQQQPIMQTVRFHFDVLRKHNLLIILEHAANNDTPNGSNLCSPTANDHSKQRSAADTHHSTAKLHPSADYSA